MLPRHCNRCRRPIWVWPWQRRLCRDSRLQTCWMIHYAIEIEEGLLPEPTLYPIFESPPADMHTCSMCWGVGKAITRIDWERGPIIDTCPRCHGGKVDPACLA